MNVIYGDLFKQGNADAICISTNGFVTNKGRGVMGKGCAKKACTMIHNLPAILGKAIKANGNVTQVVFKGTTNLVSVPVKPENIACHKTKNNVVEHAHHMYNNGDFVPGFHAKATLRIVINSCHELVALADKNKWEKVILPRLGCGAGELEWREVYHAMNGILDDRFHVITFPPKRRTIVYVQGSKSVKKLSKEVKTLLDNAITKDAQFVVGDYFGTDTLIQEYLHYRKLHDSVRVYHAGKKPRNNLAGFPTVKVEGSYLVAEVEMAEIANVGLTLCDGKSKTTRTNSLYLKGIGKFNRIVLTHPKG